MFNQTVDSRFSPGAYTVLCPGYAEEVLPGLPDNFFRLILTSPPYNIGKIYEQRTGLQEYLDRQTGVIRELCRVLAPDGSIVWQVGNYVEQGQVFPLDIFFFPIFHSLGCRLRNRIVWHYGHGLHCRKRFSGRYETALWFTKGNDYVFNLDAVRVPSKYPGKRRFKGAGKGQLSGNPLGKNPSDFWPLLTDEWESGVMDIPQVKSNHPEKTLHPCQFPVELAERFVLALSNEDDFVLDPFAGVGSTAIAALKRGRRAMLIEKEKKYLRIAYERILAYRHGCLRLRPIGKEIPQPAAGVKTLSMSPSLLPLQSVSNHITEARK
jgi:DNA modification methylase